VECLDYLESGSFSDYTVYLQSESTATSARNAGIERAEADKLVFLDDDSRPRNGYLSRMSEILETETAVAGGRFTPRRYLRRSLHEPLRFRRRSEVRHPVLGM